MLGVVGGLLGLHRRGVQQPLGVRAGPAQQRLGLGAGRLGVVRQPLAGLGGDPLGLRAGGAQRLVRLRARLLQEPPGLRSLRARSCSAHATFSLTCDSTV